MVASSTNLQRLCREECFSLRPYSVNYVIAGNCKVVIIILLNVLRKIIGLSLATEFGGFLDFLIGTVLPILL